MKFPGRRPLRGIFAALTLGGVCLLISSTPRRDASQGQYHPSRPAFSAERAPDRGEVTLLFAGDVMLARGVGALMESQGDWTLPFREIAPTLRNADLRFCNLECPISDRGRDLHHLYSFRADPRALAGLKTAGFEIVSQANNHAYDWGPAALKDTLDRLRAAGIQPVGAGENCLAAHYPAILTVGGLRVAFLAYVDVDPKEAAAGMDRPGVAWLDPAQALADVRFARSVADLVVVCPHWGAEYASKPGRAQVQLAHQMIAEGADLIVGSHPHVVQPLESYHGRWIAYSLGNFVFDQKNSATRLGLLLKVKVRQKRVAEVAPIPIRINAVFQPVLDARADRPPTPIFAERSPASRGLP